MGLGAIEHYRLACGLHPAGGLVGGGRVATIQVQILGRQDIVAIELLGLHLLAAHAVEGREHPLTGVGVHCYQDDGGLESWAAHQPAEIDPRCDHRLELELGRAIGAGLPHITNPLPQPRSRYHGSAHRAAAVKAESGELRAVLPRGELVEADQHIEGAEPQANDVQGAHQSTTTGVMSRYRQANCSAAA